MRLRWHWGTGIALAYTAFAAATLGFALFAMEQPVELVSGDYYQRALTHDARMVAEANAAAARGAFRIAPGENGRAVTLSWLKDAPAAGAGSIVFYRPSNAQFDRVVAIQPDRHGTQQVSLDALAPGRWVIQVQWQSVGRDFYVEEAIGVR